MLYKQLTENDIAAIASWIDSFGLRDGIKRMVPVEKILSEWNSQKEDLFKLFGKNLILTKKFEYERDITELSTDITNAIYDKDNDLYAMIHPFYVNFCNWAENFSKDDYWLYRRITDLFKSDYLSKNVYTGETFSIILPNDKPYRITNGQKMMKIMAKLASAFEIEDFETFRLAHSQILNDKHFHGELCLSIHPLDYMTMSDNMNGWGSCMSWRENGDYRLGTLEMMNSPMVVVAYLKAKTKQLHWDEYSWNSKIWRELFIVDSNAIIGIKGYPYWNQTLQTEVIKWLAELYNKKAGEEIFESKVYNFCAEDDLFDVYNPEDEEAEVVEQYRDFDYSFTTGYMYNDFCYGMHGICFAKNASQEMCYHYSGSPVCLCCGETGGDFGDDDCSNLVCFDCDEPSYCFQCGGRVYEDDVVFVGDHVYCRYCYEQLPECAECGEITESYETIHLAIDHEHILRYYHIHYCDECYDKKEQEGLIHKTKSFRWYGSIKYILIDDFGIDAFEDYFGRKYDNTNFNEYDFYELG